MSTIAQYRTQEIPGAIATLRNMDYTDLRLYKSGLLRETIEAHFWLIESEELEQSVARNSTLSRQDAERAADVIIQEYEKIEQQLQQLAYIM